MTKTFSTHGHKSNGSRTKIYVAWVNMKGRCNCKNRPDYKNYVGISSYNKRFS